MVAIIINNRFIFYNRDPCVYLRSDQAKSAKMWLAWKRLALKASTPRTIWWQKLAKSQIDLKKILLFVSLQPPITSSLPSTKYKMLAHRKLQKRLKV